MKILFTLFCFLPFFSEASYIEKTNKTKHHSIKKKIVLLDDTDNKLLLVEIEPFLEASVLLENLLSDVKQGIVYIEKRFPSDSLVLENTHFNLLRNCNACFPKVFEFCPKIKHYGVFSLISSDYDYDLHKAVENGKPELTKFILRFCRPNVTSIISDETPLQRAIQILDPALIKILLSQPNIIVNYNNLLCVKERFDYLTSEFRQLEINGPSNDYFLEYPNLFHRTKDRVLSGIGKSKKIGKMLINHLGLYSAQSRISKQGIIGLYGLPPELAVYIATFIH